MSNRKEAKLSEVISGFEQSKVYYQDYEVSFRRWLVSQIDQGRMSFEEARERFDLSPEYKKIIRKWQNKYSDDLHASLQAMTSKERADQKALEKRIQALEKQLEIAQMKNVGLNTMIDIAEQDYKLEIRKKSGPKQ